MTHHHLQSSPETCHWGFFEAALKPVLTVRSGDEVTVDTISGGPDMLPDRSKFHIPPEMLEQKLDKLWSHPVQPAGVVTVLNLYPQLNNPRARLNINPYLRNFKLLLHDYYQRDYSKRAILL